MARAGYVQGVKSRGKYFFYVRKSFRNEDGKPRTQNLMALGQKEKALETLESWIDDPSKKPDVVRKYNTEVLKKWIHYIHGK